MVKRIEIKFVDTDNEKELSYSQPKAGYSRRALLEKLKEYEEEMIV